MDDRYDSNANIEPQVGGNHYRKVGGEQHWDRAIRLGLDFFQYQITKYVERWKDKGGYQDLDKAAHFMRKYLENYDKYMPVPEAKPEPPASDLVRGGYAYSVGDVLKYKFDEKAGTTSHGKNGLIDHVGFPISDRGLAGTIYDRVAWIQARYVFEGAKEDMCEYTCKYCRAHVVARNPIAAHIYHEPYCSVNVSGPEPGPAYVNQG